MDSDIYCRWVASGVVAISWGGNEGGFVYGHVALLLFATARQFQPAVLQTRACMGALWALIVFLSPGC